MKDDIDKASKNPEALVLEAVHSVGYKGGLANPLLAQESSISSLNSETLEEFVTVSFVVTWFMLPNLALCMLVSCCVVNLNGIFSGKLYCSSDGAGRLWC